jgi:hypothetical protein
MKMPIAAQAQLTVVAEFPEKYFLENLAVREDGSILVTALNRNELWLVPAPAEGTLVEPALVHTFEFNTMFVVEWRPDRFLVGVSDVYHTRDARLYEMDMRGWAVGQKAAPRLLLDFPEPKVGLNGGCLLAPNVLLAAGAANLIWRVDLADDGTASARIWLQHDNMKNRPGEMKPDQPGANGVQYAARSGYVFYTTTSQQLMMRVRVDPRTLDPVDLPEFIAGGRQWDDFLIDEDEQVAYATTHCENTIDRVKLEPDGNRSGRTVVAGEPFTDVLIGPSSGAWRRGPGDHGRTAYFATDGGTAAPPDGIFRTAKLVRVVFPAAS